MYAQDTFFHLSLLGRTGLAFLSLLLGIITIWIFLKISSRFARPVKVCLAVVFLSVFIWLSPQIYYFYYLMIFEDLPTQIIIQWPPSISEIYRVITFSGNANLSEHSKGALFWIMIIISLTKPSIKSHSSTLR